MIELMQQRRYWRFVLLRALRETIGSWQLRAWPLIRKGLVWVAFVALLFVAGEIQPFQNKLLAAAVAIAVAVALFFAEFLVRAAMLPARLAAEAESELNDYRNREVASVDAKAAEAEFRRLLDDGRRVLAEIPMGSSSPELGLAFLKKVEAWDAEAGALIKKHSPKEHFAYSTMEPLPIASDITSLGSIHLVCQRLHAFMARKIEKARLIGMRVAGRADAAPPSK